MKPIESADPRAIAIADWAKRQAAPPATRKPRGAAGHISPAERREIQLAYLATPGATISSIARDTGRTREAISGCVKGEDFERLQQEVHAELVVAARHKLAGGVVKAADSWVSSMGVAATKGDHKPSKDLLLHTGVIEPLNEGSGDRGVSVWVGVSVAADGTGTYRDTMSGRVVPANEIKDGIFVGMPGYPSGPDPLKGLERVAPDGPPTAK